MLELQETRLRSAPTAAGAGAAVRAKLRAPAAGVPELGLLAHPENQLIPGQLLGPSLELETAIVNPLSHAGSAAVATSCRS